MKKSRWIILAAAAVLAVALAVFLFLRPDVKEDVYFIGSAICVDNIIYEELSPSVIQELGIAVDSLDGLEPIGTYTTDSPKRQGLVYAHPDPRYSNLIVAPYDGKVTLYRYSGPWRTSPYTDLQDALDHMGFTSADSFAEIRINRQEYDTPSVTVATIRDPEEFAKFYDSLKEIKPEHHTLDRDQSFPNHYLHVTASNGLTYDNWAYYPNVGYISTDAAGGMCSDAFIEWFDRVIVEYAD